MSWIIITLRMQFNRSGFSVVLKPYLPYSGTLPRYWCTNCTAIEPSPTADATHFTDRWRASPAAKMPATLVS